MDYSKATIHKLIIEGKLEKAIVAALAYAEYCGLADIANALRVLASQATQHHKQWNSGLISYEDFSLSHARLGYGLTKWVDRLPDVPKPAGRRRHLLTETKFKNRIFYLLCFIKVVVILRLAYHWSTGGYNNDQFYGTAALLAPALAAYLSVMLADFLRQTQAGITPPRYLSGPLITFSYWLFPIYAFLLIFFIEMKAKGTFTYSQVNLWLALTESALGGYIGQIVFAFFKKQEDTGRIS